MLLLLLPLLAAALYSIYLEVLFPFPVAPTLPPHPMPHHQSYFHFHLLRLLYELHFMKMQLPVRCCHCRRKSSRYHCRSRSHCSCCCLCLCRCRCIAPPSFRVHCKYFIIAKFCQLIPCACESCCELGVSRSASACRTLPADRRKAARQHRKDASKLK